MSATGTKTKMQAVDFLCLPETSQPIQLIEGEVILSPAPRPNHQWVVFETAKLLDEVKPHGKVWIAPLDVVVDEENVVQPDVFWISEESACRREESRFYGAPDLVVEMLSPATMRYDRVEKFLLYERVGVREYWLVDPDKRELEVWAQDEGKYALLGAFFGDETFRSSILGVNVDVSRLFAGLEP